MVTNETQAYKDLKLLYPHRKYIIPCLLGAVGIGKSQSAYQLAEELGVDIYEVNLSGSLPSEVTGINMPDATTKLMEVFDSGIMSRCKDGDILLFDEILEAADATRNPLLTFFETRRMPSGKMLPDVFIICASNPLPTPTRIKLSQRNRLLFLDVIWDEDLWRDYIKRVFDVVPPHHLCGQIQREGNDWNVLTPRSATKFIQMLANQEGAEREQGLDLIARLFGRPIRKDYERMFALTGEDLIVSKLRSLGVSFSNLGSDAVVISVNGKNGATVTDILPRHWYKESHRLMDLFNQAVNYDDIADALNSIDIDKAGLKELLNEFSF